MPLRPHHAPSRPVTTCHVPSRPCYNPVTSRYDPITSLSHPLRPCHFPVTSLSHPVTTLSLPVTTLSRPVTTLSRPYTTLTLPCHIPLRPCHFPVTSLSHPVTTLSLPVTTLSRPVTTLSRPHSPGSKVIVRSRGRIQLILKTPRNGLHLNSLRALRSTFSLFFLGTKRGRFVTAFTHKFTDIGRNWSLNIITNIESQQTWKRYRPNRSISQRFYSRGWSHGKRCLLNKSCVPPILVFLQNPRWHPHDV